MDKSIPFYSSCVQFNMLLVTLKKVQCKNVLLLHFNIYFIWQHVHFVVIQVKRLNQVLLNESSFFLMVIWSRNIGLKWQRQFLQCKKLVPSYQYFCMNLIMIVYISTCVKANKMVSSVLFNYIQIVKSQGNWCSFF